MKSHSREEPVSFDTAEQFQEHLLTEHKSVFPESQLSLLVEGSARSVGPVFDSCPLCGDTGPEDLDRGDVSTRNPLVRHIANHLIFLALRSLPWDENEATSSVHSTRPETRGTIRNEYRDAEAFNGADFEDQDFNPPLDESFSFTPQSIGEPEKSAGWDLELEWGAILNLQQRPIPKFDPIIHHIATLSSMKDTDVDHTMVPDLKLVFLEE
jgi:hypothetical protein